jgi:hypothetical protein
MPIGLRDPLPYHMVILDKVRERAGEFDTLHFHIDHLHFPHFRSERGRTLTMLHGRQDLADHMQLYQRFSDVGFHLARYGQVVCAGSRHIVEGLRVSLSKVPQWRFLRTSLHPAFEGLTGLIWDRFPSGNNADQRQSCTDSTVFLNLTHLVKPFVPDRQRVGPRLRPQTRQVAGVAPLSTRR